MKIVKQTSLLLLLCLIAISISHCRSAQKLQSKVPLEIGIVYYQTWIAGVKGGGSGVNLYIPIISNTNRVELDSVYFHGKVSKLEAYSDSLFIGRFKTNINQKKDMILSSDPLEEYGNQVPKLEKEIPFKLNENQCVISYKEGSKIKYFKIENIKKKELLAYPSVPHKKE